MADNTNIIVVGNVAFTDQGTWQSGYSYQDEDGQTVKGYDEGDIVHTSTGVFASLEDGNTTTPSDTNAKWRLWLDKTPTVRAQGAADDANKAANLAQSAAKAAGEQGEAAASQAALAETKAAEADAASKRADAKIAQMDGLAAQIATGFIAPARMNLAYLPEISLRNKVAQRIAVQILPSYLPQSVLFQRAEGDSLVADPSGNLTIKGEGTTKFWIIPTANTPLWQEVSITVRQPRLRLSASSKLRKVGDKLRIV